MALTDVVIEICDARLPEASSNPMIRELRLARQRPCLKVLNKADLADPSATRAWLDHYDRQPGVKAVAISAKNTGEVRRLPSLCKTLAPHRNSGVKPLRMLIMGIPNVGKSTLMNALLKRRVAAVGDEPAVTKAQLCLDLSPEMTITDTPGLMWPKIQHENDGYMLAASHAVGRNAVIDSEVACFLISRLSETYPDAIKQRYGIGFTSSEATDILQSIAIKRACTMPGRSNEIDLEKAAMIVLTDYRSGKLGRITLETPTSRLEMLAAHSSQELPNSAMHRPPANPAAAAKS